MIISFTEPTMSTTTMGLTKHQCHVRQMVKQQVFKRKLEKDAHKKELDQIPIPIYSVSDSSETEDESKSDFDEINDKIIC